MRPMKNFNFVIILVLSRLNGTKGDKMAILVLGGAGYIGSHMVSELCDQDVDVVVADSLETGHIEAVNRKAKFFKGDIRNREFIDEVLRKIKLRQLYILAYSLVGESMGILLSIMIIISVERVLLFESMVAHNVSKLYFLQLQATYGEPVNIPILETDRTLPTNPYGETKLSMEKMFKWCDKAHGLRSRFFKVF